MLGTELSTHCSVNVSQTVVSRKSAELGVLGTLDFGSFSALASMNNIHPCQEREKILLKPTTGPATHHILELSSKAKLEGLRVVERLD